MLGKLIKHEFKACARYFVPIYVALLLVFLLNGFTLPKASDSTVSLILIILLVSVTMLFIFINLYVTIKRFASSVYGSEGYLTNTLPVTANQIIASKAITILIYSFFSAVILGVSIMFLMLPNLSKITIFNLGQIFSDIMKVVRESNVNMFVSILNFIAAFVVTTVSSTITLYLAISVANLKQCVNHKYIYGFITYFALSAVESGISNFISDRILGKTPPNFVHNNAVLMLNSADKFFNSTLFVSTLISAVFMIIAWICVNYIMTNKLNLE